MLEQTAGKQNKFWQTDSMDWIQKAEAILLAAAICCFGFFYEGFAAVASLVLLLLLQRRLRKNSEFQLSKSLLLLSICLLPAAALITVPYAIDSGMAVLGIIKFLPAALFALLMMQEDEEQRERLVLLIPAIAAAVTLICLLCGLTPADEFIFINKRFSGTFQYANSYAMFLLISLLIVLFSYRSYSRIFGRIMVILLMTGIILTGSRAVFFLTVAGIVVWIVYSFWHQKESRRTLLILALLILSIVALCILLAFLTGHERELARFTQINWQKSTHLDRLLFFRDGLTILGQHPFGLGYKGYLFYQGSVQSGDYAVTYVHNDLMQCGLDFGIWLMVLLGIGYAATLIKKNLSMRNRVILAVMAVHGLFDWDFQFVVMLMILILLSDAGCRWCILLNKMGRTILSATTAVLAALNLWVGSAALLEFGHCYEAAASIFPGMTTSQMQVINAHQNDTAGSKAAASICKRNDYCTIALQAMAEQAARRGDFEQMAKYGEKFVKSAKYNETGYGIYVYLLSYAVEREAAAGNQESALKYLCMAGQVKKLMENAEESFSPLAEQVLGKVKLELPDAYAAYVERAAELTE